VINFGHLILLAPVIKRPMSNRTRSWPIESLPFEELLAPIIESFRDPEEGRGFDWSRSAIRQLYDRVEELVPAPDKDALLALIRDQLGEFDCLAICSSGLRDRLIPGNSTQPSMDLPTIHPPIF
jgi:hypothetical protein